MIAVGQIGVGTVISGSATSSCTTAGVTTSATGSSFEIIAVSVPGSVPIAVSVMDSKSNSYTRIGSQINDANAQQIDRFLCTNGTGGASHTATATLASSTASWTVFFLEITGAATSGLLDQSNNDTGYLSQPWSPGNITLSAVPSSGEMMVVVVTEEEYPGTIMSAADSFTIQQQYYNRNFGNPPCAMFATRIVTANGTYTTSVTTTAGGSTNCAILIDSFLGGASAPAGAKVAWLK